MLHPKRWTQIFPPAPTFGEKDLGLKKGNVFIVTGGNQGVGFELCKMLRGTGATVYIASRSKVIINLEDSLFLHCPWNDSRGAQFLILSRSKESTQPSRHSDA
jgi:predicted ATPase